MTGVGVQRRVDAVLDRPRDPLAVPAVPAHSTVVELVLHKVHRLVEGEQALLQLVVVVDRLVVDVDAVGIVDAAEARVLREVDVHLRARPHRGHVAVEVEPQRAFGFGGGLHRAQVVAVNVVGVRQRVLTPGGALRGRAAVGVRRGVALGVVGVDPVARPVVGERPVVALIEVDELPADGDADGNRAGRMSPRGRQDPRRRQRRREQSQHEQANDKGAPPAVAEGRGWTSGDVGHGARSPTDRRGGTLAEPLPSTPEARATPLDTSARQAQEEATSRKELSDHPDGWPRRSRTNSSRTESSSSSTMTTP